MPRIKRLFLPSDFLLHAIQPMPHWPDIIRLWRFEKPPIPADAKIEHINYNNDHRLWVLTVSHDSFDDIPVFQDIPSVDAWVTEFALHRDETGAYRNMETPLPVRLPAQVTIDPRQVLPKMTTGVLKECRAMIDELLANRGEKADWTAAYEDTRPPTE